MALYWLTVWIFMITAFTAAWSFIVKGCEALDEAHPPDADELEKIVNETS